MKIEIWDIRKKTENVLYGETECIQSSHVVNSNIYLKEYNFEEIVINLFKQKTIHFVKIDYLRSFLQNHHFETRQAEKVFIQPIDFANGCAYTENF